MYTDALIPLHRVIGLKEKSFYKLDSRPALLLSPHLQYLKVRIERANSSTMEKIYRTLKGWKENLHPRRIDLVGDYAGRELFIIEGDSLLRQAASDERIDMEGI